MNIWRVMKTHEQIAELIKDYNKKIADGEIVDLDDLLNLSEVEQRIEFFKEFMREENTTLMKEELCNIVLNNEGFFGLDRDCLQIAINHLNTVFDATSVTKQKAEAVLNAVDEIEEAQPELAGSEIDGDEMSEVEKTMAFLKEVLKRDVDVESNVSIFKKKMQEGCEETKFALCNMIFDNPDLYKLDEHCLQIAASYLGSIYGATPALSRIEIAKQKFSSVMNSDDEQAKSKLCNEILERGVTHLNDQDWGRLVKFLIDDLNHKIISAMLRDKAKRDRFETIMKSDDTYAKQQLAKAMLEGELVIAPSRQKWESMSDVLMAELKARIEKAESMRVSKGIAKSQMLSVPAQPVVVQQGGSVDDDNSDAAINNTPSAAASAFFAIPAEQKQEAVALVEALRTKVYGEKVNHEGAKLGLDNDAAKGKPKFAGRRAPTRKPLSERGKPEGQVAEPAQQVEEVVVAPAPVNITRRRPDARASMHVTDAERNRVMAAVQSEGATNSTNHVMATTSVPTSVARHGVSMGISGAVLGNITLRRTQQQAK
jgi:hypothetical protein